MIWWGHLCSLWFGQLLTYVVSHELGHSGSRDASDAWLSQFVLSSVGYMHFMHQHKVHHKRVSSPSAPHGSSAETEMQLLHSF